MRKSNESQKSSGPELASQSADVGGNRCHRHRVPRTPRSPNPPPAEMLSDKGHRDDLRWGLKPVGGVGGPDESGPRGRTRRGSQHVPWISSKWCSEMSKTQRKRDRVEDEAAQRAARGGLTASGSCAGSSTTPPESSKPSGPAGDYGYDF